jgi:hypothetical protein
MYGGKAIAFQKNLLLLSSGYDIKSCYVINVNLNTELKV